MIINGKTTSAEIFTDNIEETDLDWLNELCGHPAMEGIPIVQMPDVHAGASCNVGTAYPIGMYVNPDHVGVDIGCTISMHQLSCTVNLEDFPLLDHRIREAIPTGSNICLKNSLNEKELFRFLNSQYQKARSAAPDLINEAPRVDARFITDFCRRIKLQEGIFYKSLGTLGGGNHFIEYYYCPLNHNNVSPTSRTAEVGLAFFIGQAPSVALWDYGRRFRGLDKHVLQVCIGLIEELFEIQVIHQDDSHDCSQPGEAPTPVQFAL